PARRSLEVRSPSRNVKRQIGFHFGTGFAAGIGESTRTVVTASRNLAQSAFSMLDRFTDDADGTAFAAPFVNNVSSMTDKVMTHFQTFKNKLTNAMDNVKDILDQNLSGDINLDVATENIKKTLN
ncbi:hypothetical protein, partial [Acinetobacter baumannii]|uniref:hypothetical protein n=1 Tax=Acinetobacter baumannii TaxID=470 RepID=UPI00300D11E1